MIKKLNFNKMNKKINNFWIKVWYNKKITIMININKLLQINQYSFNKKRKRQFNQTFKKILIKIKIII